MNLLRIIIHKAQLCYKKTGNLQIQESLIIV
jgi:hypothetical protein